MTVTALANIRDVSDGLAIGTIRRGVLLRSDAPMIGDQTPVGIAWPPSTIVDLRHPVELMGDEHPLASGGAVVHRVSLVDPAGEGPRGAGADDLSGFYSRLLTPPAIGLVEAVELIAAAGDGPVLVHCLAGKDRTGVVIALVLRLVGVVRSQVINEYLLTNLVLDQLMPRLNQSYAAIDGPNREARTVTRAHIAAPREHIVHVMDVWDGNREGTLGWYLDNGGNAGSVAALTARLVEP